MIKNTTPSQCFLWIALALFTGCAKRSASAIDVGNTPGPIAVNKPVLSGKLVFHRYSEYGSGDSRLYLYDFSSGALTCPSLGWTIVDPMNGHFSPDGSQVVFMGRDPETDNWNIYLWTIRSPENPVNLTAGNHLRNEDPKFSPDGMSVVFKQDGQLATWRFYDSSISVITNGRKECSMPYFEYDGQNIIYASGAKENSGIFTIGRSGDNDHEIVDEPGIQEYYPVVRDSASFFYSRWYSASNHHDQVFIGSPATRTGVSLPFNSPDADYSDAFPCGADLAVLSSTRAGGRGGYDLYLSDIHSGQIWTMDLYSSLINSDSEELGACYTSR